MANQKEYFKKNHYKWQKAYAKRTGYKYLKAYMKKTDYKCQKAYMKKTDYKYQKAHLERTCFIWKNYFIKKYGANPLCEVCKKQLQWIRKNAANNTVYFDHKSEGKYIKIVPSLWYRRHPCTEKNIKIWEKEAFGILCCRCNNFLPTENRLQWLKQITNYIIK